MFSSALHAAALRAQDTAARSQCCGPTSTFEHVPTMRPKKRPKRSGLNYHTVRQLGSLHGSHSALRRAEKAYADFENTLPSSRQD